jgi:hypothetical protein
MKMQSLIGCHVLRIGHLIVFIYLCQGFDHIAALFGEVERHLNKLATAIGKAVCQYPFERFRGISRKCITHLDKRAAIRLPLLQQIGQILTGMFSTGIKQCDFLIVERRDDTGGKNSFNLTLNQLAVRSAVQRGEQLINFGT